MRKIRSKNLTQNQKNHKNLDFHQREQKVDFTWFDSILLDFTQIRSNTSFPLMISIINSPYLYGKPPSLLRDSGSKNPIFSWKSAFLKKEKTWSHIISKMLRCALFLSNQQFWGKKISKKISTRPSLKFAKNGRPEPLWSRGFSVQMLCALLLKAFTVVLPSKTCRAYLRLHAYACNRPKCGKMRQNAAKCGTCRYVAFIKGNMGKLVLCCMSS